MVHGSVAPHAKSTNCRPFTRPTAGRPARRRPVWHCWQVSSHEPQRRQPRACYSWEHDLVCSSLGRPPATGAAVIRPDSPAVIVPSSPTRSPDRTWKMLECWMPSFPGKISLAVRILGPCSQTHSQNKVQDPPTWVLKAMSMSIPVIVNLKRPGVGDIPSEVLAAVAYPSLSPTRNTWSSAKLVSGGRGCRKVPKQE